MIKRMLAGGLVAGFAAGLFAALLHFVFIQDLILLGEQYESGAVVHFGGAGSAEEEAHANGDATAGHGLAGHDLGDAEDRGDQGAFSRNLLTVLFTGLIYASYGLLLVAGFGLAQHFGRHIDRQGAVLWGIAGFVAFQLAPAMGLAPELPGTIGAELGQRQAWWLGTVIATAGGLGLLAYGRGILAIVGGAALLAAPHLIGAPEPGQFWGVAPPELGAAFAARVLGVGLVAWVVLGWIAGWLWVSESD